MSEPVENKTNYCQQCDKWFQKTSSYKVHMGKHAGKRHYCDVCDKSYTAAHSLLVHKRTHTDYKPYKCQYCDARFFQSGHCHRHENALHSEASVDKRSNSTRQLDPSTDKYTCKLCGQLFKRKSSYVVHLTTHGNDNDKHTGSNCEADSEDKDQLKPLHNAKKSSRYKMKSKSKATNPVIVCRVCRRLFSCMSSYRVHEKKHKGVRHYCTRCAKSFTTHVQLKAHEKDHDQATKYKCTQCDKSFNRRSNLARHKHLHTGLRRYVCHVCGKAFILLEGYSAHLKVHQNEPSAWCNICGAAFKFLSSLKAHKKMHSNKKDFKCEVCDREFLRKRTLEDHMKVHEKGTNRKALISAPVAFCLMCSKGFSTSNGLQRHMRKHRLGLLKNYNRIQAKSSSQNVGSNSLREKSDQVVVQTEETTYPSPGYQAIDPEYFLDKVSENDTNDNASSDKEGSDNFDVDNLVEGISASYINGNNTSDNNFIDCNETIPNNKMKLKDMYADDDTAEDVIVENDGACVQGIHNFQDKPVQLLIDVRNNNGTLNPVRYDNISVDMHTFQDIRASISSDLAGQDIDVSASSGISQDVRADSNIVVCEDIQHSGSYGGNYLLPPVTNLETINEYLGPSWKTDYENENVFPSTTESNDTGNTSNTTSKPLLHENTKQTDVNLHETVPTYIAVSETSLNSHQLQHIVDRSHDKIGGKFPARSSSQENAAKHVEINGSHIDGKQMKGVLDNVNPDNTNEKFRDNDTSLTCKDEFKKFVKTDDKPLDEETNIECRYCMYKYANLKSLKMHLYRYHPDGENDVYTCDTCGKMFASKLIYLNHIDNHKWKGTKLEEEKPCDVCGDVFRSYLSYHRHMRIKHRKYKDVTNANHDDIGTGFINPEEMETVVNDSDDDRCDTEQDNVATSAVEHSEEILRNDKSTPININGENNAPLDSGQIEVNLDELETDTGNKEPALSDCSNTSVISRSVLGNALLAGQGQPPPKPTTKFQRKYKCTKCDKSFYMLTSIKQHMLTHSKCNKRDKNVTSNCTRTEEISTKVSDVAVNCNKSGIDIYIDENKEAMLKNGVDHQIKVECDESSNMSKLYVCNTSVIVQSNDDTLRVLNDTEGTIDPGDLNGSTNADEDCLENDMLLPDEKKEIQNNMDHSSPLECQDCEQEFVIYRDTLTHVKTVHCDRFLCEECPKKFCTLTNLKRHMDIHHAGTDGAVTKNYMCKECGKCFTASDSLRIHMFTHSGERPYECKQCTASFTQSGHLHRHVRIAHTRRQRNYACKYNGCQKSFYDQSSLSSHGKVHSPLKCKECQEQFVTFSEKLKHVKEVHGDRFLCENCPKKFCTLTNLKRHMDIHHASDDGTVSKKYMCTECGKCFTASDSLRIHMFSHSGERPYKCKQCTASYLQSGHLQRHIRTAHTRQRLYVCKHTGCQKSFYDQSSLTAHEKIHSDVRQHQCTMCLKYFKTRHALKKHIKTHQDTKDFECHICYQTLSTNHCLQRHLQRHVAMEKMDSRSAIYDPNFRVQGRQRTVKKMEEKQFQCEFCKSKFTTTRGMLAHQRKFCKGNSYST